MFDAERPRTGLLAPPRRDQIIRLLETRHDHLPVHRSRRDQAASGFVHDTLAPVVCPTCEGVDSVGCTGCGGRGSVEVKRTRDPYAVDKVQPYGMTPARHEAARERDAQIDRLARQTRKPWASPQDELADANQHPYQWERARQVAYRDYDYAALDLALEALRMVDDTSASMLVRVFEYQLTPEPHAGTVAATVLEQALRFISDLMPDPVRAPAPDAPVRLAVGRVERTAGRNALAERNQQIRAAINNGEPTRDVAKRWGLSVSAVNRAYQEGTPA